MPFPNQHSARFVKPEGFDRFRQQNRKVKLNGESKTIGFVFGIKSGDPVKLQSIRFPIKEWTETQARKFARDQDANVILFEKATKAAARHLGPEADAKEKERKRKEDEAKKKKKESEFTTLRKKLDRPSALAVALSNFELVGEPVNNAQGQPVQRFRKEIIRDGIYKHPSDGWSLLVGPERRQRWATAFNQMKKAGVAVPVPDGHVVSADKNRGWVIDMEVEAEANYAVIELVGQDAIDTAGRSDVSVYIDPEFADGKGVKYGEALTHVALTPTPVVPGMGGFVPIAASLSSGLTQAPVFTYHAPTEQITDGDDSMALDFAPIAKALGVETVGEEDLLSSIEARLSGDEQTINTKTQENADLQTKLTEAEKGLSTNKDKDPNRPLDPDTEDSLVESAEARIEALIGKHVSKACGEALALVLIGEKGKRKAFALSRQRLGLGESLVKSICEALKKNDPVVITKNGMTGPQSMSLDNPAADDGDSKPGELSDQGKSLQEDMRAGAGLSRKPVESK